MKPANNAFLTDAYFSPLRAEGGALDFALSADDKEAFVAALRKRMPALQVARRT
jgi:hypothetical protein